MYVHSTFFCFPLPSRQLDHELTGMAIADITLLSGFEVEIPDLDKVCCSPLTPLLIVLFTAIFIKCEKLFQICYFRHI